jgi:hypothetical protein
MTLDWFLRRPGKNVNDGKLSPAANRTTIFLSIIL